nr:ribonuclease T2 [uncultured Cohaesibacter sp.]
MAFPAKHLTIILALLLSAWTMGQARADRPGDFDYYLLTLSWSPSYCADDGRQGRDKLQCFSGRPYGFVIHGLWPQYERGYPEFCSSSHRKPSSRLVDQMLKYSPSRGLIHHEWKKHGSCTGLSPLDYFRKAVKSFKSINRPNNLIDLDRPLLMTAREIRTAFQDANPDLPRNSVIVTCKRKKLREVRICFDKQGRPRTCSPSARKAACRDRGKLRILAVR